MKVNHEKIKLMETSQQENEDFIYYQYYVVIISTQYKVINM